MSAVRSITLQVTATFEIFWLVTPCCVAIGYHSFGRPCCLHPDDGGNMDFRSFGILSHHYTRRRHNPEDLNLNLHRRESLKTSNRYEIVAKLPN